MVESTGDSPAVGPTTPPNQVPSQDASAADAIAHAAERRLTLRALLEAGCHFGHQTRRWDPRMKPYIYGERNGIHIINLDHTHAGLQDALEFLRETVASGGKVLFVGTKRQAQGPVQLEAERSQQFYVNNRWLGGMLTNFRTVKKSIDRFKERLALLADEEQVADLTKKELARLNREITKYRKALEGIQEMTKLPDALFVVDVGKERIAISEARRLGIPVVAVVDTNCSPESIQYVIPGNDDAVRAIQFYCSLTADACLEGGELFNERVQAQVAHEAPPAEKEAVPSTGRVVVEIHQPPRRAGRGGARSGGARREKEEKPGRETEPAPDQA